MKKGAMVSVFIAYATVVMQSRKVISWKLPWQCHILYWCQVSQKRKSRPSGSKAEDFFSMRLHRCLSVDGDENLLMQVHSMRVTHVALICQARNAYESGTQQLYRSHSTPPHTQKSEAEV